MYHAFHTAIFFAHSALVVGSVFAMPLFAQQDTQFINDNMQEDQTHRAKISDSSFTTVRDQGMSGFLAPYADGLDATLHNPAGIGGLHYSGGRGKNLKQFHFPYLGTSYNKNSQTLNSTVAGQGGATNIEFAKAITAASDGHNQYARSSFVPDIGFGRFIFVPILDQQTAAAKLSDRSDQVELLYQKRSGAGVGVSFNDPTETLYLGMFGAYSTLNRTTGIYSAADVADTDGLKEVFKNHSATYTGMDLHVGLLWRIHKKGTPVFSLTSNHANGGTIYKSTDSDTEDLKDREKLNAGFSATPILGNIGYFNIGAGAVDIGNRDMPFSDKWRANMELNLGNNGTDAIGGVRVGVNSFGTSYGAHVNIGFIGLQYADAPENIGTDDKHEIERRQSAAVSIDLAR